MRISDWSSDVCSSDLAARYKDEPWVGGYDLVNEPNWSFATPGKGHGCDETENKAIWDLQRRITAAIRAVDQRHMVIVEGNCWGNNYRGLPPAWDDNLVLSFHKYWNRNRSEEQTSELQSLMRISYAVFFLKKKKRRIYKK